MTRIIASATLLALTLLFIGCSDEDDPATQSFPARPTEEMLDAGPEAGKEFLKWNQTGYDRGLPVNFQAAGTCYPNTETDIEIECMIGLHVSATANPSDTLHCTMTVEDSAYTLSNYEPDGTDWADSVLYWVDTTVVRLTDGVSTADITFYWYDDDEGFFEEVETQLIGDRWVASTHHFSRYVLGQKRNVN